VTLSVQPPLTQVPQLAGRTPPLDLNQAALLLLNAKLDLKTTRRFTAPALWGKVIDQNPSPGNMRPLRTPVALTIGSNNIRPDITLDVNLAEKFRELRNQ
jgi:beta-lactam-binding protein with PASTA domain